MADAGAVHRAEMQLRFADLDALGHVNNVSFAIYAETARVELLAALGQPVQSVIIARLAVDFRRPVAFGAHVHVETTVAAIGRTSVTLQQAIIADGAVAADVSSVLVFYDYAAARPRALPADVRAMLARYEAREAVSGDTTAPVRDNAPERTTASRAPKRD